MGKNLRKTTVQVIKCANVIAASISGEQHLKVPSEGQIRVLALLTACPFIDFKLTVAKSRHQAYLLFAMFSCSGIEGEVPQQ